MARPRTAQIDPPPRTHAHTRRCDAEGCPAEGAFRAPQSRAHLDQYFWFCLDHVREYNAAWNFYAGMSEAEIEAELRRDSVGQRPTWPLGWRIAGKRFRDPFDMVNEDGAPTGEESQRERRRRALSPEEKALQVFEMEAPFTLAELKKRYKLLVKAHHPDANGGDKGAEERLKVITQAYATLKSSFFPEGR
jgi:DnaJ-domain-containing protein 1